MSTTTREEAQSALRIVRRIYGGYGYRTGSPTEERLIAILTTPRVDPSMDLSEEFRTVLLSIHGNVLTSRTTTYEVFGSLGRLGETEPAWI